MAPATKEPTTIPILEALIAPISVYAKLVINKDMVNPIPAKKPTPITCVQLTPSGNFAHPKRTLRAFGAFVRPLGSSEMV